MLRSDHLTEILMFLIFKNVNAEYIYVRKYKTSNMYSSAQLLSLNSFSKRYFLYKNLIIKRFLEFVLTVFDVSYYFLAVRIYCSIQSH